MTGACAAGLLLSRPKPYGPAFRGKNMVFPLTQGRAALCRRLAFFAFFSGKTLYRAGLIMRIRLMNSPSMPRMKVEICSAMM